MLWPSDELGFQEKNRVKTSELRLGAHNHLKSMRSKYRVRQHCRRLALQLYLKLCYIEDSWVLGALMHQICGMNIFHPKWWHKIICFENLFFAPCRVTRPILPTVRWGIPGSYTPMGAGSPPLLLSAKLVDIFSVRKRYLIAPGLKFPNMLISLSERHWWRRRSGQRSIFL